MSTVNPVVRHKTIEQLNRENAELLAGYNKRTDYLNTEIKWREELEAELAVVEAALGRLRYSSDTVGVRYREGWNGALDAVRSVISAKPPGAAE